MFRGITAGEHWQLRAALERIREGKRVATDDERVDESQSERFERLLRKAQERELARLRGKFQAAVDARVQEERQRLEERERSLVSQWRELDAWSDRLRDQAAHLMPLMSHDDAKLIRSCLHPDRLKTVNEDRLAKAYRAFNAIYEKTCGWVPLCSLAMLREWGTGWETEHPRFRPKK
jgi:hypothetical protein